MRRRTFLGIVGGAAASWPFAATAQQTKPMPRVGVLWHAGSADEEEVYLSVLQKAFRDLGYIDGKNIGLEHRFPAEQADRFHSMAQELVDSKVDVIVAVTAIGARDARKATNSIPIVVVLDPDPVGNGLVQSLSHPGGNVTGLSLMGVDLSGKRLALFKEAVPGVSRVALIIDPKDPSSRFIVASSLTAAKELGIELRPLEVTSPDLIDKAVDIVTATGCDGLIVGPGSMMFNERARIGALASTRKIPMEVAVGEMVAFGALFSYGPDFPNYFRRAVAYADRILKGAKPADLPVEQPSRFKLTINLKTAKSIGVSLPPSFLASADEVIE